MRRPKPGTRKRVPGKRDPLRVIRVLTEGTVTEPGYISLWARRNRGIHVDFAEAGMAPLTLVQRAREHQRSNKRSGGRSRGDQFDEIWCIFDVDEHPQLTQALSEARQSNISVALSNPCFELWLVLHEQDQTAYVHHHDVQKRAEELGIVRAKRIHPPAAGRLVEKYDGAKRRAITLQERHELNGSELWSNPSSDVWQLVDRLK